MPVHGMLRLLQLRDRPVGDRVAFAQTLRQRMPHRRVRKVVLNSCF
jgi:hypothetical protein